MAFPSQNTGTFIALRSGRGTRNGVQIRISRKHSGRFVKTWVPGAYIPRDKMSTVIFFILRMAKLYSFRGGENCAFFERAIFEKAWASAAPALRFLAVSLLLLFFGRGGAHFGDLELTGTKKRFAEMQSNVPVLLKLLQRFESNSNKIEIAFRRWRIRRPV